MNKNIKHKIISDKQIKKFSAYGFLRNFAFFKPFLLVYLMSAGISMFQVGLLYSIREIVIYIFEVPSGIIADYYGRKKEMYMCFIFYIISFIIFAFAKNFVLFALAMVFFGLGEAFRTGTHKAMILSYIEKNDLLEHKAFVYGRTRSFSLLGNALSSLVAIAISLYSPDFTYMFTFSIVAYVLNLMLIYTYPDYLDKNIVQSSKKSIRFFLKEDIEKLFKNKNLRKTILNQAIFQALIKSLKDIIQPIVAGFILASGILIIDNVQVSSEEKIVLGLFYFFVALLSSFASRNAYKTKAIMSTSKFVKYTFWLLGFIVILISISLNYLAIVFILFVILNVLANLRKPIYIDLLDEQMDKRTRATVISLESQITAVFIVVFAPIFGYLADNFSISLALLLAGLAVLLVAFIFALNVKTAKS